MNSHSRYLVLAALISGLCLGSAPALSQSQDTGLYAGVNVGSSKWDVCVPGLTSCDDKDTALSIFGGYQFNKNFAAEIAYTDLGKITFAGPGGSASADATGFEFLAVGIFPINEKFSIYGKLGFFMWEVDVKGTLGGFPVSLGDNGTDLTYGFGVRWNITKNLALQAQWQRYDVDTDVDVLGVGILFRF